MRVQRIELTKKIGGIEEVRVKKEEIKGLKTRKVSRESDNKLKKESWGWRGGYKSELRV